MADTEKKVPPEPEPARPKPEHGADSQLRCYNAQSWRLDYLFGNDEEPEDDPAKPQKK